ncbi:NUDIX domain-containing protein [Allonocardiopsis opalescens]|uniref:ADP-ribose pyrophosphatase YjhB (NUDIX family) n=1 Tax=Allonocardiopsis opalescens TaxID=1144618 RepID=A0A2T0PPI0_9ACTN|nr:NUDIX domain-containing protein [Allonocardiopsis opalescens]PRX90809.1 ADP-ribose pyrophosphatase YjhB (NUDIX family) [Allonocardiopsis opalescens]
MTRTRRIDYWQDPNAPAPTSRKASASVFVRDDRGRVLLLQRTDNNLWTIPTGGVKTGETVAQAGIRECKEETGIDIEVTGLVGIFSDPDHLIAYIKRGKVDEVRQPINTCFRGRPVGGRIQPEPSEAFEVRWVDPADLGDYDIHPAIRRRIDHGLKDGEPYLG